jgi:hypothetical protein
VFIMLEESATAQSAQEAGDENAGLDRTWPRRPEPEWQRTFTDLLAEIAWGTDTASDTVQRLARRCTEALKALAGGGDGRATK